MPGARQLEAEWLDHLPADDPRARRSRRDLARINAVMLQPGIMARAIHANARGTMRTIADLGAGDGTFMLRVLRGLNALGAGAEVVLVDRQNIMRDDTEAALRALGYRPQRVTADVFEYLEAAPAADVLCVNLFLHHLSEPQLRRLFALAAQKCVLFVACEPRRGAWPQTASRMLWALGCNDVTRHDAVLSVRAGFAGVELSALWPERTVWRIEERAARLFSHLFVARRESAP